MLSVEEMQKGFNSDINVKGKSYHVQTEDWGMQNPFLVSRIFHNGAVLKTIKIAYEQALQSGPRQDPEAIKLALKRQHHQVLDQLVSGQI